MKLPASFTKAQEVQILEALATSDSYFAEFFRSETDQMTANIMNDLPIEFGTKMEDWRVGRIKACETVDSLERSLTAHSSLLEVREGEIQGLKARMRDILGNMIHAEANHFEPDYRDLFTFDEILKAKLEDGCSLNAEESTYLLSKIS